MTKVCSSHSTRVNTVRTLPLLLKSFESSSGNTLRIRVLTRSPPPRRLTYCVFTTHGGPADAATRQVNIL
jgi:hypothetical protein